VVIILSPGGCRRPSRGLVGIVVPGMDSETGGAVPRLGLSDRTRGAPL